MEEIYLINKTDLLSIKHESLIDFSKIDDFYLQQRFNECEENCIKQVLRQLLCREPTIENAKKLIIGQYQRQNFYDLAYEGMMLGRITKSFENNNYTVKFEPAQFKTHI